MLWFTTCDVQLLLSNTVLFRDRKAIFAMFYNRYQHIQQLCNKLLIKYICLSSLNLKQLRMKFSHLPGRVTDGSIRNIKQPIIDNHGHSFAKKTFNCPRPVYCHHCLDLLNWSLFNSGLNCEGKLSVIQYQWFNPSQSPKSNSKGLGVTLFCSNWRI